MVKSSTVVIVGAGASGVQAATKLIENGIENVLILEANDRIGGRVNSIPFGLSGGLIDLGAQWVSGENDIYHMMKDHFNFGETGLLNKQAFVRANRAEVDEVQCARLYELGGEILSSTDELKKSDETYGEFFNRKYVEALQTPEFQGIDRELAEEILHCHQNEFNITFATSSWYDIAAKYVADSVFLEGSQSMTWKKAGYKTVFDFMINELKKTHSVDLNEKILLNKKVVNIDWTLEKASVKCEDGSEFSADHVIVTIPHGVLKSRHQQLFTPALPDKKVEAIDALDFGTIGKVFLEFEERFFPTGVKHYIFLWSAANLKEIRGTEKEWLVDLYGFMHVDDNENMIESLIAGNSIKDFETYEDSKIIADCMWLLEKFLEKSSKQPINMARTQWMTNENFLGSYTHPSTKGGADASKSLSEPILSDAGKPSLLFAGEATSESYMGYVHGAMQTGKRVAQELIDFYKS